MMIRTSSIPAGGWLRRLAGLIIPWMGFCLLTGCASAPAPWEPPVIVPGQPPAGAASRPQTSTPVPGVENIEPQELIEPAQPVSPIAHPLSHAAFEVGWLVGSRDRFSAEDLLGAAAEGQVTQVQVGGDVLQAVDDLILDSSQGDFVRQLARQLDAQGIDTLVWSRELHLESKNFRFLITDPLVAARQAAYRTALTAIPEIDGVVLSFDGALLEPWNAEIPSGFTNTAMPDRIRFIIDMVKPVIVDEMGKRLFLYVNASSLQAIDWITEALSAYPADSFTLVLPLNLPQGAMVGPVNPYLDELAARPRMILCDLAGGVFGGPRFLVSLGGELGRYNSGLGRENWRGMVTPVHLAAGAVYNSLNAVNLLALAELARNPETIPAVPWTDWIQRTYGAAPMTREGQTLRKIYESSYLWACKLAFVKQCFLFADQGDLPLPGQVNRRLAEKWEQRLGQGYQYACRELRAPRKQTLLDITQEAYEAMNGLEQALQDLENIRNNLHPMEYEDLNRRLVHERRMAEVMYYAKQTYWGLQLWESTKDEDEALCLEANLQRLERLADEIERNYGGEVRPGDPGRIREWVSVIRHSFPRVLFGARERNWNKIQNVVIRQTGPSGAEVQWTSAWPSTSRIFVTTQLPVYDRMQPVSEFAATRHQIPLENLQPGVWYYIKIQCTSEKGEVTNSGEFRVQLEAQPVM
ncbi:MAG: fibronectin type III domain-containing protein [bacterium]